MQPPSTPKLNKTNPNKWYICWSHDVPPELWPYYSRKRERIKKYDNINRFTGDEREKYANERLKVWTLKLSHGNYNPFLRELEMIRQTEGCIKKIDKEIKKIEEQKAENPLYATNVIIALEAWCKMKVSKSKSPGSKSNWRSFNNLYGTYFKTNGFENLETNQITHKIIVNTLEGLRHEKKWSNTTLNNNRNYLMMFLGWLIEQEYLKENPSAGKIKTEKENHTVNTWYDRDRALKVKKELIKSGNMVVYRASQFTYWLCIRSQQELFKLKVGDIDTDLKRVRFSAELAKNNREAFRDYSPEFEKVLKEMDFKNLPKHYYLFGKQGLPGEFKAGKNTLSNLFRPIKEELGLSDNYTIYGWKHTRVVHEMMKGTDPYIIQHICRHGNLKETMKYMRDFDMSLKRVYEAKDLTF